MYVYKEFSKAFDECFRAQGFAPEEAMAFVRDYLSIQNNEYSRMEGDCIAIFDGIVVPYLW